MKRTRRPIGTTAVLLAIFLSGEQAHGDTLLPYATNQITPTNLYSLQQKVQWDGGRKIQTLRTEHFEVYMAEDEEALASRIARLAEEWYPELEERMAVRFDTLSERERIPLIGYTSATRFQSTNTSPGFIGEGVQGFFDLIRGRIVIPFTGSNELLEHVIRHEMVHAFTLPLLEDSWKEYKNERERAKERRERWHELVYVARRMTEAAPNEAFPRFVRGSLDPTDDEVGLPPTLFGEGFLHPQIFLRFAEEGGRRKNVQVVLRLANREEARALGSADGSVTDLLVDALRPWAGRGRSEIRVLHRPHPWIVEAPAETLFASTWEEGEEGKHLSSFLRSLRSVPLAARNEAPGEEVRADILVTEAVPPESLGEIARRILPLYRALSRIPYSGPVLEKHRSPSYKTFRRAEEDLFRFVPPDLRPRNFPLSVLEGTAEYYAAEWSDLNDVVLRDLVHEGRVVPFHRLTRYHGFLVYVEGLSFFLFLSERYGEEKIALLLESLYRGRNLRQIFEAVYGLDAKELSDLWLMWLKRKYLAQFPDQLDVREYAEKITDGPFDGPPRAESGRLLYSSLGHGRTELLLREGEREKKVARDRLPGFESLHLGDPALDIGPTRAAFVALSRGRDEVAFVPVRGEGEARRRFESILTIESLALSPDEKECVFAGLDEAGQSDLYRFVIDGGGLQRLTDDPYHETDLDWGDGGILFSADRAAAGAYDIFRIAPTGEEELLVHLPEPARQPRWWRGKVLFLLREGDLARNVYLFDPAAGERRRVTRDAVGISAFDVDGDSLVVRTNRGLRFSLWKTAISDSALFREKPVAVAAGEPPEGWSLPGPVPYETSSYKPSYGPDIFFVTGSAFYSRSVLGLSDIMGNRRIALFLGSNADRTSDFAKLLSVGATVHLLGGRTDYRLGAFRYGDEYLTDDRGFFFRRETGLLGGVTYPFDRFRSVGANLLVKNVREEPLGGDTHRSFGEATVQGVLGYDTAVPGPFGYGFGDGTLASVLFSSDWEFTPKRDLRSSTVLLDFRRYVPLGHGFYWAGRASGGLSWGDFPQRILIGGSYTLRGYDFLSLEGDRYLLANQEVRFPFPLTLLLADMALLTRFQGAAFVDAGDAWFAERSPQLRGSTGFGLRTGFGAAVLRWDLAKRFDREGFFGGWETDFFVGWNF